MHPQVIAETFGLILLLEIPDKTFVAELIMSSRYRALPVWLGSTAAFAVHVAIASLAGRLLLLAPKRAVDAIVAVLFVGGAAILALGSESHEIEKGGDEADEGAKSIDDPKAALKVVAMAFGVIFLGEWGDLTQILMANLTAKYHSVWSVATGSLCGLATAAAVAVLLGRAIVKVVPLAILRKCSAVLFLLLGVFSAVSAIR